MPDPTSGIDLMRRRIERASRQPPPAPRERPPAPGPSTPAQSPAGGSAGVGEGGEADVAPTAAPQARRRRGPARPRLGADLPPVNLAIRVRKPLDDHLADLIHDLRREGVRTSKVELIEMLLWEQTDQDARAVRERLATFREAAPRGAGAPL